MTTLLLHLADVDEANWAATFAPRCRGSRWCGGRAVRPAKHRLHLRVEAQARSLRRAEQPQGGAVAGRRRRCAAASIRRCRGVPIVRFVDADLTQRMSDYVVANVTMHQRLFTRFKRDQQARRWMQHYPPAAGETHVGDHGAWGCSARTPRRSSGCSAYRARLEPFAQGGRGGADVRGRPVRRLPRRDRHPRLPAAADARDRGILNYELFKKLRRGLDGGPVIINAARGGHQATPTSCARWATARSARRASTCSRRSRCRGQPALGARQLPTSRRTSRRSATSMPACAISQDHPRARGGQAAAERGGSRRGATRTAFPRSRPSSLECRNCASGMVSTTAKAGGGVDLARRLLDRVGPEPHALVTVVAGKANGLRDQRRADRPARAPRARHRACAAAPSPARPSLGCTKIEPTMPPFCSATHSVLGRASGQLFRSRR